MKKFDPNRFHHAVMVIALMRARKAVQAQLRAKGEKPQLYSMREITLLAEDYFAQHREQIIKKAAEDVATFPEFARRRCAQLSNSAQTEEACNYSQIPVQKSGVAEWRTKNDRGLCACQH